MCGIDADLRFYVIGYIARLNFRGVLWHATYKCKWNP